MIRVVEHEIEEERAANLIMAAASGALTGVKIAVAVGAMVLAFVALVALANGLLGGAGQLGRLPAGQPGRRLGADLSHRPQLPEDHRHDLRAGHVSARHPVERSGARRAACSAPRWCSTSSSRFIELGAMTELAPRTVAIITFALCGFANFSSIAIQMAATGSLAPNQRPMIAKLGIRALIAGSLANLMSAALAGLLLP